MFNGKIILLVLLLMAVICPSLAAGETAIDNISVIEKNCLSAIEDIQAKLTTSKAKVRKITLNEHSSSAYFYNMLWSGLSAAELIDEQNGKPLNITIIDNNIKYNKVNDAKGDIIERIADINISFMLAESRFVYINSTKDTIDREDIPWAERGEFPFAKSPLPKDKSWYDAYIAPAIVVASSVLGVVILFMVRSK